MYGYSLIFGYSNELILMDSIDVRISNNLSRYSFFCGTDRRLSSEKMEKSLSPGKQGSTHSNNLVRSAPNYFKFAIDYIAA